MNTEITNIKQVSRSKEKAAIQVKDEGKRVGRGKGRKQKEEKKGKEKKKNNT